MKVLAVSKNFQSEYLSSGKINKRTENKQSTLSSEDHAELSAKAQDIINNMRKKAAQKRAETLDAARKTAKPEHDILNIENIHEFKRLAGSDLEQAKKYILEAAKAPDSSVLDSMIKNADPETARTKDEILEQINTVIKNAADKTSAEKADVQQGPAQSEQQKTIAEMLEEQQNKIENMFSHLFKEDKAHQINVIRMKMRSGKQLSPTEKAYLSVNNPDMYERYQSMESVRQSYRKTLNSCRTKDEVNGIQLSNALSALSHYKKALREGGNGDDVVGLYSILNNEINEFRKSSNFNSLPTNAECNKFHKDLAKAKKYEQEKRIAKRREQLEKLKKKKLKLKKKNKKLIKTPGDGKRTVSQVLNSPTAKKVLGSMTRPRYTGYTPDPYRSLNKKK